MAFLSGADSSRRRRSAGALCTATVASTAATAACRNSCRRSSSASRPLLAALLNRSSPVNKKKAHCAFRTVHQALLAGSGACCCTQLRVVCSAHQWPGSNVRRSLTLATAAAALPHTRARLAPFPENTALSLRESWARRAPAQQNGSCSFISALRPAARQRLHIAIRWSPSRAVWARRRTSRSFWSSARARSRSASTCFASSLSCNTCFCSERREICPPFGGARMPSGSCVCLHKLGSQAATCRNPKQEHKAGQANSPIPLLV